MKTLKDRQIEDFGKNVDALVNLYKDTAQIPKVDGFVNPLEYAQISEHMFLRALSGVSPYECKFTWYADLAIAEWFDVESIAQTVKDAFVNWQSDYKALTELVLCINWKCWEHYERNNDETAKFYSELYYMANDLLWLLFEGDSEASRYIFEVLD